MSKERKTVARVIFKPRTDVKNYIYKYDDNSILMETLFLNDSIDEYTFDKLLCSKFGKHLYLRVAHTSFDTISVLNEIVRNENLKGFAKITIDKSNDKLL